jgi:hypothetical protein
MSSIFKLLGKSFGVFIVVISFFYFVQSAHAATLSLNPSTSSVTLGQEFDVQVRIDTQGSAVSSADVLIGYDKYLLDAISVTSGINGLNSFFPDFFQSIDTDFGRIYIGASVTVTNDARIGQGAVGTIRFKSKGIGQAVVGFLCQPGQTNDTNIILSDQNATDIVNCASLKNVYYNVIQDQVALHSVNIHASSTKATVGKGSVGLSALAYDQYEWPIWDGVTYEWGISSANSVGSVSPINGTIANFMPLNPGTGDVYVVARMGTQTQSAGVQMTVTEELRGDLNDDGKINLSDLSALLSNFGKSNRNRSQGDVNGDNTVGLQDLTALLSGFGKSTPIAGALCRQYSLSLIPENQSVQTGGYGTVTALLNPVTNTLNYSVSYTGLSSNETMAHIHGFAGVGQTAGVLHTLPTGITKTGTWQYQESQEQNILNGLAYFNIHSAIYPSGELRAQVQGGIPADCQ